MQDVMYALHNNSLTPGAAAELEGKLMFSILSQFGKIGRAALTVLRARSHDSSRPSELTTELRFAPSNFSLIYLITFLSLTPPPIPLEPSRS